MEDNKVQVWHIVVMILAVAIPILGAQWFSDNYHFDGFKVVVNDDE